MDHTHPISSAVLIEATATARTEAEQLAETVANVYRMVVEISARVSALRADFEALEAAMAAGERD